MEDGPVSYLHNMVEELNRGANPDSSGVRDLNQGPPDFKSSALNHSGRLPPFSIANSKYFTSPHVYWESTMQIFSFVEHEERGTA